jgi:hypothetical protein
MGRESPRLRLCAFSENALTEFGRMFAVKTQRPIANCQSTPLNNLRPPLNFVRFFKTLRYFVAPTFAARL